MKESLEITHEITKLIKLSSLRDGMPCLGIYGIVGSRYSWSSFGWTVQAPSLDLISTYS